MFFWALLFKVIVLAFYFKWSSVKSLWMMTILSVAGSPLDNLSLEKYCS